ncbi:hypothetical protein CDL15_Pgr028061 [Punica granatum]|uniref:Late embryogenesis abundant protein LEA-2 subgroup domain-containing protein n=1 Tax=Punica granatum TaxID=22663 RepID=A0A218XK78_PUNGR|nr:hypothetical protein CDL15_Pgr028061 [Punica granatum]PKI46274.1 hypothetical protein CRG98_033326 [Punica granatum]
MAKDMESFQSQEDKRRKRMKLAAYIGAFAVFQVIVILVFALVVMKVKTPKFRIGNGIKIQSLTTGTQSSPSFDMNFVAPIRIKNTNFGPYKYDATTVNFSYGGVHVGQVTIPKSKANFKSTKKVDVTVSVNSDALTSTSGLGSELNSKVLTLNSRGRLNGKVELMLIFKKKKSTNMNCTMAINVSSKVVQSLTCK